MMEEVKIKPISANEAFRGRRFKSKKYEKYIVDMFRLLPRSYVIPEGKLEAHYVFGVSSKRSDYDNLIKQTQDILAAKYGFDDKMIYRGVIEKVDVKKGEEFVRFEIVGLAE